MLRTLPRRFALKCLSLLGLAGLASPRRTTAETPETAIPGSPGPESRLDRWDRTHDRVFLGGDFWANPMEDWQVRDGWAECLVSSGKRNIHSLTRRITDPSKPFHLSVRLARPEAISRDDGAGFRLGIRSDLDEVKSNCFATNGIDAGLVRDRLVLGRESTPLTQPFPGEGVLVLSGSPAEGPRYDLTLSLYAADGTALGSVSLAAQKQYVSGNVALVSQLDGPPRARTVEPAWRFTDWRAEGAALSTRPNQRFGPVLWTQYTLSDSRGPEGFVLKLSALLGPLGEKDNRSVELLAQQGTAWESLGQTTIDPEASLALFRIPNWDETKSTPFKVVYREVTTGGEEHPDEWTGTIRANPAGRPLRIGALTCQNDYAFPYAPVNENLVRLDPDLLYFSGDQLYESHGGFGVIRSPAAPAILNYLRKFYQHGWSFREAMRDRPSVSIPDDHDVFHGNYWGEGGTAMEDLEGGTSSQGGYIQPVRMVDVVHRTCTAHHPDPHDPTPIKQGMSVYYGELVYGGVGFAILGDRQFKSGPGHVETGEGRPDHVLDASFDTSTLDKPGLVLLGERQEQFLETWAADWRGHSMKILLSQTPFSALATHHGDFDGYLKADLDSNSWPQTPRNRAISILRKSKALHVNGDQHLATLSQYGVEKQRDANWSFCTPAIAVGYPRWWRPDELAIPHANRPAHGLPDTGEYLDGFENKVYVHAVGNPIVPMAQHRYEKAHEKGSGFGLVTVDTGAKTYTMEAFKFLIDATDGKPENQFPGWPLTIHEEENQGFNRVS